MPGYTEGTSWCWQELQHSQAIAQGQGRHLAETPSGFETVRQGEDAYLSWVKGGFDLKT